MDPLEGAGAGGDKQAQQQKLQDTSSVEYTDDFDFDGSSSSESEHNPGEIRNCGDAPEPEHVPPCPSGPRKCPSSTFVSRIPVIVKSQQQRDISLKQKVKSCGDGTPHHQDYTEQIPEQVEPTFFKKRCTHTMRPHQEPQKQVKFESDEENLVDEVGGDEEYAECPDESMRLQTTASLTVQVKRCGKLKGSNSNTRLQLATRRTLFNYAPIGFVQKRVASAKRIQVKDLMSKIRYLEGVIEDLKHENRTLQTLHLRQDVALKRYEGTESELDKLISQHKNEVHYLQANLRRSYGSCRDSEDQVRLLTQKMGRLEQDNRQLQELVKHQNLDERQELADQLKEVATHAEALEGRLMEYERHVQVLEKNHIHQIEVENAKVKNLNKKMFDARKEAEILAETGRQKDRIINYLRMRCGREQNVEPPMVRKMYKQMNEELQQIRDSQELQEEPCQNGPRAPHAHRHECQRIGAGQTEAVHEAIAKHPKCYRRQTPRPICQKLETKQKGDLPNHSSKPPAEPQNPGADFHLNLNLNDTLGQQQPKSSRSSCVSNSSSGSSSRKSLYLEGFDSSCNVSSMSGVSSSKCKNMNPESSPPSSRKSKSRQKDETLQQDEEDFNFDIKISPNRSNGGMNGLFDFNGPEFSPIITPFNVSDTNCDPQPRPQQPLDGLDGSEDPLNFVSTPQTNERKNDKPTSPVEEMLESTEFPCKNPQDVIEVEYLFDNIKILEDNESSDAEQIEMKTFDVYDFREMFKDSAKSEDAKSHHIPSSSTGTAADVQNSTPDLNVLATFRFQPLKETKKATHSSSKQAASGSSKSKHKKNATGKAKCLHDGPCATNHNLHRRGRDIVWK